MMMIIDENPDTNNALYCDDEYDYTSTAPYCIMNIRPNQSIESTTMFHQSSSSSHSTKNNDAMTTIPDIRSTHSTITLTDTMRQTFLQTTLTIIIGSIIIFIIIDAITTNDIEHWLVNWIELVEKHVFTGILVIVIVYIIATICFVPGSVLTIGVGYAFSQAFPHAPAVAIPLASIVSFVNHRIKIKVDTIKTVSITLGT